MYLCMCEGMNLVQRQTNGRTNKQAHIHVYTYTYIDIYIHAYVHRYVHSSVENIEYDFRIPHWKALTAASNKSATTVIEGT